MLDANIQQVDIQKYPNFEDNAEKNQNMFAISLIDIFGWLGSAAVVMAYALISTDRLDSKSVTYHLLNLFGGACLVVNGAYYGAYPSAFVNIVWLFIAFSAIVRMGQSIGERGRDKIAAKPSSKMN